MLYVREFDPALLELRRKHFGLELDLRQAFQCVGPFDDLDHARESDRLFEYLVTHQGEVVGLALGVDERSADAADGYSESIELCFLKGLRQKAAIAWVEDMGGRVWYDDEVTQNSWLRQLLGEWFPVPLRMNAIETTTRH